MVERRNISCAINAQTRLIYTLRNITSRAEFMKIDTYVRQRELIMENGFMDI